MNAIEGVKSCYTHIKYLPGIKSLSFHHPLFGFSIARFVFPKHAVHKGDMEFDVLAPVIPPKETGGGELRGYVVDNCLQPARQESTCISCQSNY